MAFGIALILVYLGFWSSAWDLITDSGVSAFKIPCCTHSVGVDLSLIIYNNLIIMMKCSYPDL